MPFFGRDILYPLDSHEMLHLLYLNLCFGKLIMLTLKYLYDEVFCVYPYKALKPIWLCKNPNIILYFPCFHKVSNLGHLSNMLGRQCLFRLDVHFKLEIFRYILCALSELTDDPWGVWIDPFSNIGFENTWKGFIRFLSLLITINYGLFCFFNKSSMTITGVKLLSTL